MADDKLGKYEIRGTLGRGAMGTVYDGWDPIIARRVAIKTVRLPQATDAEAQEELARFRREAQAAGRLNHPNIVGVFDYGETEEVAFIVMEYVDGRTLKALIDADERMAPPAIAHCMEDILAGLQYSHDRGVVHRDIKPANIMLTLEGKAKIADFGIARIESSSLTQAGTLLGTPAYMSPEQFMGQVVDLRTDIYSSGVLLYQLLTGERPFEGSMTGIMHKVLNTVPPRPSELSVTCPPGFDTVVGQAMAKRPADRFDNARAFADAIHAAVAAPPLPLARDPILDAPDDIEATMVATKRAPPPPPVVEPPRTVSPVAKAKRGVPGGLIGAVVVVLLLIGGGGAYYVLTKTNSGPQNPSEPERVAVAPVGPGPVTKQPDVPITQPSSPSTTTNTNPPVQTGSATSTPATNVPITTPPVGSPPSVQPSVTPPPFTPTMPTPAVTMVTPSTPAVTPSVSPPSVRRPPISTPTVTATVVNPQTQQATTPVQPPPPIVATQPVEPAPPTAAAIRQAVTATIANASCSLAYPDVADGSKVVTVRGLASAASATTLRRVVQANASGAPLSWQVDTFTGPYCGALDALRPVAGPGVGLTMTPNRTMLRDDELLTLQTVLPDFPAHLIVDYLGSDGSVTHLVPTPLDVTDHSYPDRVFPARSRQVFGEPNMPKYTGLRVGPPFGTDMIITLASQTPLLAVRPNQSEDKADGYIAELQAALDAARRRGTKVAATAFLLEIAPKP